MDISEAKLLLTNTVKSLTDQLAAAQLALDIVSDTFKAEFTSLETAQQEANDNRATLAEKDNQIDLLTRGTVNVEIDTPVISVEKNP